MTRIFVWEASTRSGLALLYQPAIYHDGLPTKLSGEPKPVGTFIFVHHELETEKDWGLFRFCNAYPCPATRKVDNVDQVVQSSKDINKTQAGEGLARYLDRVIADGGNGGSTATYIDQADERSTQDQRGHDIERTGSDGSETQSPKIYRTGEGSSQDGMASNNGNIQISLLEKLWRRLMQ